jgi:ribosomal protein S19
VVITPDMVGQRVAVFVGEEFKTERVRMSREQSIFRRVLESMGGRFRVARSE